ncbi:MAG: PAS domain S-box protein [Methanoregula sp.]|nr:MAG: PAS domain S-box protein [Methanoregula sp.]
MVLKRETTAKIKDLLGQNPKGLSITQIVNKIDINRNTAGRYLENLMVSGQVEMRKYGMAKIYRLAQRIPLSAMLSISSELIMLLDNSLRIIYANEPMYRFLDTTQDELYGKNIEFTPCIAVFDDTFDSLKKHIKTGLAGREWRGELPLTQKGVIFFCRIAPAVFEEGQRGVSVLLEDITDWKRAEDSLKESQDRYRKLVEISPDAVILHRDGRIMYMNPAALQLLGFSRLGEVTGTNVLDLVHPAFRDAVSTSIQKDVRGERTPAMELQMFRADGTCLTVEGRGVRTSIEGRPAVQVAIRDITEQKHSEAALRESEERLRSITVNSPDMILLIDTRWEILFINRTITLGQEDIVGKTVLDFIPEGFKDAAVSCFERVVKTGKQAEYSTEYLFPDGEKRHYESVVGPVFCNNEVKVLVINARDVTKRRRVEAALRESEATARALINAPTDSVLLLDMQGVILDLNETAARRLGKPKNEMIGMLADTVLPKDVAQARRSMISRVITTKEAVRFEDHRDGIWFDTVAYPVRGANGEVKRIAIIARDITDRKRVEEALRQSEGKLNAMLQSITDPMTMMDGNLTLIWANDMARRCFGNDIVGRKCYEVFHQRQNPCEPSPCLTLKAFRDGKIHRHETTVIDLQGKTRFFDCTANVALRDETGRPTAVLEISRDITEWKQAEESLRESEEKYRNLIERANDGVCVIQDGVVKFCNRRITEFWGGSIQETLGRNFTDFVHPDAVPEITDLYKRRMAGETVPSIYTTRLMRKDGSVFYAEVNAGLVTYGGKPGDLIIIRDINDRKKGEE